MTAKHSTLASADRVLVIKRIFDAPRALVFQAWTQKEHMDQWSAPEGFTIPFSEADLRPGGKWRAHMLAPDGSEHRLSGVYTEIAPSELLAFTHAWEEVDGSRGPETLVTVRFTDHADETMMTFEQSGFTSIESRDGHAGGWNQCFDRLSQYAIQLYSDSQSDEICITRTFDASRELVFKAWTDENHLLRWYAPTGCRVEFRTLDVREGGTIHSCIHTPDGHRCWCKGVYREIKAPERLVYTMSVANEAGDLISPVDAGMDPAWPSETVLTVTFEELDGKTLLTLRQTVSEALAKKTGAHPSWLIMLDRLASDLSATRK